MHNHHAIDYVEFTVRDLGEAKRFYTAAFGWAFNDYGPEYAGIQGKEGEVGGLHQTTPLRRGGPLVILYSDNLEATLVFRTVVVECPTEGGGIKTFGLTE